MGTKTLDELEFGPVGYFATDLNEPISGYPKQRQFAIGGLVGYTFGPVNVHVLVTRNTYQKNFGGDDTRAFVNVGVTNWSKPQANPPVH
jgi:hypothetical protein